MANYVKFIQGTPKQYDSLKNLTKVDSNALYFISEVDDLNGKLYLGEKLMSTGISYVKDLEDTSISTDNLKANDVLAYNPETQKWENKSLSDLATVQVETFKGATEEEAGKAGLVPAPAAGETNKFLSSDGIWKEVSGSISQETIQTIYSNKERITELEGAIIWNSLDE